ncbi:MAG: hypothetical protein WA581_08255 [Candidatus Acidiferrales bacterium]
MNRPERYRNVDGTVEMIAGLILLGAALAYRLEASLPRWADLLVLLGVITAAVAIGRGLQRVIKTYWTWPRTGYVAYRWWNGRRWARKAALCIIVCLLGAGLNRLDAVGSTLAQMHLRGIGGPALLAAVYGLFILFRSREHRWKWLIFFLMVLGLLVIGQAAHGDYPQVRSLVSVFLGIAWLVSGTATLRSYMRHTQVSTAEAE